MTLSERFTQSKRQAMIQKIGQPSVVIVSMTKEPEDMMDNTEHSEESKEVESKEEFTNSIDTFISSLKSFEVLAKLLHWKTTSYAKHLALDVLVEGLSDLVDTLVETAQTERQLDIKVLETKIECSELDHVKEMLEYVRTNRSVFPYSFQQNHLDEIDSILSKTIYKLNFLH